MRSGEQQLSTLSTPQSGPTISLAPAAEAAQVLCLPVLSVTETMWVGRGLQRRQGVEGRARGVDSVWRICQGPSPSASQLSSLKTEVSQ